MIVGHDKVSWAIRHRQRQCTFWHVSPTVLNYNWQSSGERENKSHDNCNLTFFHAEIEFLIKMKSGKRLLTTVAQGDFFKLWFTLFYSVSFWLSKTRLLRAIIIIIVITCNCKPYFAISYVLGRSAQKMTKTAVLKSEKFGKRCPNLLITDSSLKVWMIRIQTHSRQIF